MLHSGDIYVYKQYYLHRHVTIIIIVIIIVILLYYRHGMNRCLVRTVRTYVYLLYIYI